MIRNGSSPAEASPTDGRPGVPLAPRGRSRAKKCCARSPGSGAYRGRKGLEKGADVLAVDPEADDAACAVDVLDRVGGDEAAAAREEAGLHGKGVRDVRRRTVHRALDLADRAA